MSVSHELEAGTDLVVGVRDRFQRISETLFAFVARTLWRIADPLCGMKGYKLSKLKTIDQLHTYPSIGTELTLLAARRKWEVGSGKWEVGSGKWEVGSGKWEVGSSSGASLHA